MGWGNTLKAKVKYRGKIFADKKEIAQEQKVIDADIEKNWEIIKQMMITSPIDYVSQFGEDCWRTYDRTLQTLSLRFDCAKKAIIALTKQSYQLSMLAQDEVELQMYGCNKFTRFFYELGERLGDTRDFGTIGEVYEYFSKPKRSLTDMDAVEIQYEEDKDSIEVWFGKLKGYALMNIKDMYCADCDIEEENVCHSASDVLYMLKNEYESYREILDDDLSMYCRLEIILDSREVAEEYIQHIDQLKKAEREWEDKKEELWNKAFEQCGIDRKTYWGSANWQEQQQKVDEVFNQLMKENNVPTESPVDWNKECYSE